MLDLLRGMWLGYPLHSVMVRFPAALWPLALGLDVMSLFAPDPFWTRAAGICVLVGDVGAGLAILFGLLELIACWHRGEARGRLLFHTIVNTAAAGIFAVALSLRLTPEPPASASAAVVALEVIGVGLMLLGNWLGGLLVYRYGLGSTSDRGLLDRKL
ncbi:MAG: DUF2231 domain-containing protein [Chloroflexota bacterium]|nr:MAG: DUF2231 domain-containing protein [Chloroflexota bacterium]